MAHSLGFRFWTLDPKPTSKFHQELMTLMKFLHIIQRFCELDALESVGIRVIALERVRSVQLEGFKMFFAAGTDPVHFECLLRLAQFKNNYFAEM